MFFVHTLPPGLASSGPHPPGPDGLATGWLVWWKNMVYLLYQMVTLVTCYYKRSINMWVVVTFQGTLCPGVIYLGHVPWGWDWLCGFTTKNMFWRNKDLLYWLNMFNGNIYIYHFFFTSVKNKTIRRRCMRFIAWSGFNSPFNGHRVLCHRFRQLSNSDDIQCMSS